MQQISSENEPAEKNNLTIESGDTDIEFLAGSSDCNIDHSLSFEINETNVNYLVEGSVPNEYFQTRESDVTKSLENKGINNFPVPNIIQVSKDVRNGSQFELSEGNEELLPPEYDEHLNHVFFLKSSLTNQEVAMSESLRKEFIQSYKLFFENRQELINELRDIADKVIQVQQSCNVSHIIGGTLGIAGGTSALIGTVSFPPLLFGGLLVAGFASLTNLGTSLTQFFTFHNLIQKVSKISKYDMSLLESLEGIYKLLISSNLFDVIEHLADGAVKNLRSTNLQLGLDGARGGALAVGIRSLGAGMVEIGSGVLKSVGRSAVGIGVIIDGVTIYICADDLVKGGNSKLSEALRKLADEKEMELDVIKRKVNASGLFAASYEGGDSYLVLSRSKMASLL